MATACLIGAWCDARSNDDAPTAEELSMLSLQELGKIKITAASMFQNNELDTPASVSIIQRPDWQRNGARRITDAFQSIASVYSIPAVFAANAISIRGLPLNSGTGILTTLDNVPIPELATGNSFLRLSGLNLGAIDLIQIVRGPGSALYGSDAFHGVVSLQSFEASRDVADIDAFAASDGYYQTTLRYSSMLGGAGRLSVAAAANGQPEQNIGYSVRYPASGPLLSGERDDKFNAQSIAVRLKSDEGSQWSYDSGVFLHRFDGEGFTGLGTVASGERNISDASVDFYMVRAGAGRRLFEHGSLEVGGYYWAMDNDAARFAKSPSGVFSRRLSTLEQYRDGLRVIYRDRLGESTQLAIQLAFASQAIEAAGLVSVAADGTVLSRTEQLYAHARRDTRTAVFEGNTEFGQKQFALTYGGRFDTYSDAGNHFSPRLGVVYRPQDDSAIKLLYGHGFRNASAVEAYGALGVTQGNPLLDPETFDTVELAWLKQAETSRMQVSVFKSVWHDGIATIPNPAPPPAFRSTNLGRTDATGAEVNHQWQIGGWSTRFDAAYVKTKNDVTGAFTTIPEFIATFGVGYHLAALQTEISIDQRVQSAVDDVIAGSPFLATQLPVYWRVDAHAATRLGARTKAWLHARNLLNRRNALPSTSSTQFGVEDYSFSIGLGIGYEF